MPIPAALLTQLLSGWEASLEGREAQLTHTWQALQTQLLGAQPAGQPHGGAARAPVARADPRQPRTDNDSSPADLSDAVEDLHRAEAFLVGQGHRISAPVQGGQAHPEGITLRVVGMAPLCTFSLIE